MENRCLIVAEWRRDPKASIKSVARKVGVDPKTAKLWKRCLKPKVKVLDKPRTGRKTKLTAPILAYLKKSAPHELGKTATSCVKLAQVIQSQFGIKVSPWTVNRTLKKHDWLYRVPVRTPLLKPMHAQKRLQWADHHIKVRTCFSRWMFTDSKIFLLEKIGTGRGLKVWAPRDARPECVVSRSTLGLHLYLGLTRFGLTRPIFVTGAQGKLSEFMNPRTGQLHTGVCTKEYVQYVLPKLKSEGNLKFSRYGRYSSDWVFQQDGAPCHAAKATKEALDELMPDRWVTNWPANSPDLSPIENFWAWAQRSLQTSPDSIQTLEELKAGIVRVIKGVPRAMCQNLIKSMRGRLDKVIEKHGGYIGK